MCGLPCTFTVNHRFQENGKRSPGESSVVCVSPESSEGQGTLHHPRGRSCSWCLRSEGCCHPLGMSTVFLTLSELLPASLLLPHSPHSPRKPERTCVSSSRPLLFSSKGQARVRGLPVSGRLKPPQTHVVKNLR